MEYIGDKHGGERPHSCIFCQAASLPVDDAAANLIARSTHAYAMLNRYPYTYGHTMIIPFAHVASVEALSSEAVADLMAMTTGVMRALRALADPQGFNIGANIGGAAGAGIAAHFHFHVVPRWTGDANFMLSIGGTQTVAELLSDTAQKLRDNWETSSGKDG